MAKKQHKHTRYNHMTVDKIEAAVAKKYDPSPTKGVRATARSMKPAHRLAIASGISLGVILTGLLILQSYSQQPDPEPAENIAISADIPEPDPVDTAPTKPKTVPSTLTGLQVAPTLNKRPIVGVMIENSPEARPQAGLQQAGVVFEAIAEGGITRFLALYQEDQPERIGPIRSARPYYVKWAAGFDAAYVHSGGSGEALQLIRSMGLKDLDHGVHDTSFERVTNRYAPHNVYTDMKRLDSLRTSLGYTDAPTIDGFTRVQSDDKEDDAPAGKPATSIQFNISKSNYNTSYTYDADANTYKRLMAGIPHKDERSGDQITPRVVIAMEVPYGIHPNGIHSVYDSTGTGPATVFQDGTAIQGTWKKPKNASELTFLTTAGKPLALNPGQTWITAIQAGKYSYK